MAGPETDGCARDPRAREGTGAAQASTGAMSAHHHVANRVMQAEIEASVQGLRSMLGRAAFVCAGLEHDAIVKAQEKLTEAEMWAKRAIGRA